MANGREILTWNKFEEVCRDLTGSVQDSGFRPDIITCIAKDDLLPAGFIGYAPDIESLLVFNVESYTGIGMTFLDPRLVDPVLDNHGMAGKRVLIVNDVVDSGRTLKFVHETCEQYASKIRTAVPCEKPRTALKCEYVWKRTGRWIVFP